MALAPLPAAAPLLAATPPSAAGGHRFGDVLRARQAAAAAAPGHAPPAAAGVARTALASVERARERLETALASARAGRTFSAAELLALQADAYRYAQTVDVASKVVEHGAQALKTAVNTQV
jgi:hypothetical protein